MMTITNPAYETAKSNWTQARAEIATATTRTGKRDAAERAEFWSGKMAMLGLEKGWAV